MEAELIRKGLWTGIIEILVDGDGKTADEVEKEYLTKKTKRAALKMAEARVEMILRVDGGQLLHMISRDPMEVWETLRSVHRARGFATLLALCRKFLTTKKRSNQSIQSWVGEIRGQAFAMQMSGIEVNDQDVILALTLGLPSSFNAVIIHFDATPPDQLTIDLIITRLLNDKTRQSMNRHRSTQNAATNEALSVTQRCSRPDASEIICFFCDQKGHYKDACPEKKLWESHKQEVAGMVEGADSDEESLLLEED